MSLRSLSLQVMRQTVFDAKPGLAKVLRENGDKTLVTYLPPGGINDPELRKKELLDVVFSLSSKLFGDDLGNAIARQLNEQWYVSTAEHHGPVSHPFVVSGTFVASLMNQRQGRNATIVFSSSNVSLNNSSFPRGFILHTPELAEQRLSLQPWKYRQNPVSTLPKIQSEIYMDFIGQIRKHDSVLAGQLVYWQEKIMAVDSFADQVSILNELFWRRLPGQENMHLIYLPQETVITNLLLKYHLKEMTEIHELIFNPEWRALYARFFDGLVGAFSTTEKRGTFLFWAVVDGHRLGLMPEGNALVSIDRSYQIQFSPKAIASALEKGELLPSMAMTFITLNCYYGLRCGGGFSQVDYLPQVVLAYEAMVAALGMHQAEKSNTTSFLSSDYAFLTLQTQNKQVLATGLDMALYGNSETFQRIVTLAETITLGEALDNLVPELYTIVEGRNKVFPFISTPMPSCLYV